MNKSIKTTSSFVSLLFQANNEYNKIVEVKRPFLMVTLTIILVGVVLFGLSDTTVSIADTSIPGNEVASSISKASNSSASVTITMYTVAGEYASKLTRRDTISLIVGLSLRSAAG